MSNISPATRIAGSALLVCLFGLVTSCSSLSPERVRKWTYPASFNYLDESEIRSIMQQMANRVVRLEGALLDESPAQETVVRLLRDIQSMADELGPGGWPSNHPRIDDNLEAFQHDVTRALLTAEAEPPHYWRARQLGDACRRCHATRVPPS